MSGHPTPMSSRTAPVKFAIARCDLHPAAGAVTKQRTGSCPACHAITASTANSGRVWIHARMASARPCAMRNCAASAAHATRNALASMLGKVHSADHAAGVPLTIESSLAFTALAMTWLVDFADPARRCGEAGAAPGRTQVTSIAYGPALAGTIT